MILAELSGGNDTDWQTIGEDGSSKNGHGKRHDITWAWDSEKSDRHDCEEVNTESEFASVQHPIRIEDQDAD